MEELFRDNIQGDDLLMESCTQAIIAMNLMIAKLADDSNVKQIAMVEKTYSSLIQQYIFQ